MQRTCFSAMFALVPFAVGTGACLQLSGADDLAIVHATDGGKGGSGGSADGSGSGGDSSLPEAGGDVVGGGSGGGGAGGACVDTIDVQPRAVQSNVVPYPGPEIAAREGRFGILSVVYTGTTETTVLQVDPGGGVVSTTPVPALGISAPTIAGSLGWFSIGLKGASGAQVLRIGDTGAIAETLEIKGTENLANMLLTGTPKGVLVSLSDHDLRASWLADTDHAVPALSLIGAVSCCADRRWVAVKTAPGFAVVWRDSQGSPLIFSPVLPSGASTTLTDLISQPTFGGVLGDNLVFASANKMVQVTESGQKLSAVGLPAGVLASSGRQLRLVQRTDHGLDWHTLDPETGVGAVQFVLGSAPLSEASVAWDGVGFGVVWVEQEGMTFARVIPCGAQ